MYRLLFLSLFVFLTACQSEEKNIITNPNDYEAYFNNADFVPGSKYFNLWNQKIMPDSTQALGLAVVAGEYNRYFKTTGDINFLKKSEFALNKAVEHGVIGRANFLRALARNYISQHRFKEADSLALIARKIGSGVRESHALLFDTSMELGAYWKAEKYLDSIKNIEDFGYLVRLAKFNDYKGDLDTAIRILEKASLKAEKANNKTLQIWSYTNLADYYGHAERIRDSYNMYLKALSLDPQNAYAKKGIAWIVYSYENNPEEALRIIDHITAFNDSPDYYLLQAEIAEFAGMGKLKESSDDAFKIRAGQPAYGSMYNMSIADHLIVSNDTNEALRLAKNEFQNRPTPETAAFLASIYHRRGEVDKALDVVEKYVYEKSSEPKVLLTIAKIFKDSGNSNRVKNIKKDLVTARFELGPLTFKEVEHL